MSTSGISRLAVGLAVSALAIPIVRAATATFEGLADQTVLTTQIPGLAFTNAIILTSGISLDEREFPPHSGVNSFGDNGGPVTITFNPAVTSFGGYFTHTVALTLVAFNASGLQVATAVSQFANNQALSGVAGSTPNELIQLSSAGGISKIVITGSANGGSFAADDVSTNLPVPTSGATVTTIPAGLTIVVDGATLTAPQTFAWTAGSVHTIGVASPQNSTGSRNNFASWSDGGAQTHTVTATASPAVYAAMFGTQYLLTTASSPSTGGTVGVTPASADGFYNSGTVVQVAAYQNTGTPFTNWGGDLSGSGSLNPAMLTMSAPHTVTANFASFTLSPTSVTVGGAATFGTVNVYAPSGTASWSAISNVLWITVTGGSPGAGNGMFGFSVAANTSGASRTGTVTIGGTNFTVIQSPGSGQTLGLQFVPVTPCRIIDTRGAVGTFGGPAIPGGATRSVPIPQSACNIPTTALAYSLNVTAVPAGPLGYLTIWPTGQTQPVVSTLNSSDGRVIANAAIVPAGTSGAISLFASNNTDAIVDINGYFAPASTPSSLSFYSLTPCRIADTRGNGFAGAFGAPFMAGGSNRSFPIPSSACGAPNTAQAYSFNVTVVPRGPLGYLTAWPTGQSQPVVSTLNAPDGSVAANAAIVPAGAGGAVSVFVTNDTDVIVDINGYFAPPGSAGAQSLYTVTPCRLVDTRGNGFSGAFGPPTLLGNAARSFQIPGGACAGIPTTAQAYSLNFTVVPQGPLGYLSAWPSGQPQPVVSTLNSLLGKIVANAGIVPAGLNGAVSVLGSNPTDLILDINAYFAP